MTPPKFHDAASLVHILALGFLGQAAYALFSPEIAYTSKTWCLSLVSMTSILLNVGGALAFVHTYGATGVAWGAALGQFGGAVLCGFIALKLIRWPYAWGPLIRVTVVGIVAATFGLIVQPANPWMQGLLGLGLLLAFVLLLWIVGDPTIGAFANRLPVLLGFDAGCEDSN
jgi:hypothetical protein